MEFAELEKKNLNFYAPRFEVEIEKKNILTLGVPITSVQVMEKLNDSAKFTLQIGDHFDIDKQKFEWLDNDLFNIGKKTTIKMGYGANLHTMIIGKIESIDSSLFSNAAPSLRVNGYDLAYSFLKKPSKEESFDDVKYSDIVEKIATRIGLSFSVDPTTQVFPKLVKPNKTSYFKFLLEKAKSIDYELYISGRTLYFKKIKEDQDAIFTLEWGKHLTNFNQSMSTAGVNTRVQIRSWDVANKRPIIGNAEAGDERTQEKGKKKASVSAKEAGNETEKVIYSTVKSDEEATNMSKSKLNRSSDKFITGSGSTIGIPELRSGILIGLDKLGTRFSGKYRVKECTHTIDSGGYKVSFTGKRNAQ
jgi:phage protein D